MSGVFEHKACISEWINDFMKKGQVLLEEFVDGRLQALLKNA